MVIHTLISHTEATAVVQSIPRLSPESYFLLGEVTHCNKAGRGSLGTTSTPGHGK